MKRRRWGVLSNRRAGKSETGLTLLEVLFALALLGMGVAVIVQGLALGLRVRRESAAMRRMTLVASNAVNLLLLRGEAPSEEEEGEEGEFVWRILPEPAASGEEDEAGSQMPLRIVVERGGGRTLELLTVFPAAEEP